MAQALYMQIAEDIRGKIIRGEYPAGAQLPA